MCIPSQTPDAGIAGLSWVARVLPRLGAVCRVGLFIFASLHATVALSTSAGDEERQFLRHAAHGQLENVFLMRLFKGYVAFPRTSVLVETFSQAGTIIEVRLAGYEPGFAYVGVFALGSDGKRRSLSSSQTLPEGPSRIEERGNLTIEYFTQPRPSVLVHDKSHYLLLTGSAAVLSNELVEASVALSGPPDVFSKDWKDNLAWIDLPAWGDTPPAKPTAQRSEGALACARRFDSTGAISDTQQRSWTIYNPHAPDSAENTFVKIGLMSDDRVVAINGSPIHHPDDWLHALLTAATGVHTTVTVKRAGGKQITTVVMNAAAINALIGHCIGEKH
jgi:hypothetical protein